MPKTILSIYPLFQNLHDSNVALLVDGQPIYAYEEEKLSRTKYDGRMPIHGIWSALAKAGLAPHQIDTLVFSGIKKADRFFVDNFLWQTEFKAAFHEHHAFDINYVSHHTAHNALSVLASPFDQTLYLSLDNGGDDGWGQGGFFDGQSMHLLFNINKPHICTLYSYITYMAGFTRFEEGKAMGLASYGKLDSDLYDYFSQVIALDKDGFNVSFDRKKHFDWTQVIRMDKVSNDIFRLEKIAKETCHSKINPMIQYLPKEDLCFTIQKFTEDLVEKIVRNLYQQKPISNICLSGGLFANIKVNSLIEKLPFIHQVYIPPNPSDGGLALGAALQVHFNATGQRPTQRPLSPYLGPVFSDDEIEKEILEYGLSFKKIPHIEKKAAESLAEGKIIGWFQGPAEFGPRALGNRSVLADPLNPHSKPRLNQLLKKRDWFMPFAPSVLEDCASQYFAQMSECRYMNKSYRIVPQYENKLGDAVHVDGSARPQSVTRESNPKFYALIHEFHKRKGIPMVLNTSFNRHGLPTICTPKQALDHLIWDCIDALCIGSFWVERRFKSQKKKEKHFESESQKLAEIHQSTLACVKDASLTPAQKLTLIQKAFPNADPKWLKHTLALPPEQAMLKFEQLK